MQAPGPCPTCGETLGGRYDGLCWPCWSARNPPPRRHRRQIPKHGPAAYERLVRRVWARLERGGPVFYLAPGHIAGWCPACLMGTVSVHFVKSDEPVVRLRPCSAGCPERLIAEALR